MRWYGLVLLLGTLGCRFDTTTGNVSPGQIDGAVASDAKVIFDAATQVADASPNVGDAQMAEPDANPLTECEMVCIGTGASCSPAGVCTYSCTDQVPCGDIVCPVGVPCDVGCTTTAGLACGNVTCAVGQPCIVNCDDGDEGDSPACNDVQCNNACSCDVTCSSEEACNSTSCTSTLLLVSCSLDDGCSSALLCDLCL